MISVGAPWDRSQCRRHHHLWRKLGAVDYGSGDHVVLMHVKAQLGDLVLRTRISGACRRRRMASVRRELNLACGEGRIASVPGWLVE
jgi:hypothetical protein